MADNAFLMYKGKPLVRQGNTLYYGMMNEPFVVMLQILSMKEQNGVQVAWISNGQWSANAIDIKDMITLGSWQISKTNGFSIRWVG